MKKVLLFLFLIVTISSVLYKNIEGCGDCGVCGSDCKKIKKKLNCESICNEAAFPPGGPKGKYTCSMDTAPFEVQSSLGDGCDMECECCIVGWNRSKIASITNVTDDIYHSVGLLGSIPKCVSGDKNGPKKKGYSFEGWWYNDPTSCSNKKCGAKLLWGHPKEGGRDDAPGFMKDVIKIPGKIPGKILKYF